MSTTTVEQIEQTHTVEQADQTHSVESVTDIVSVEQVEQTHQVENVENIINVEAVATGPRGPKGDPADMTVTRTAAEDISAVHFVAVESDYTVSTVTWSDTTKANQIIGIATSAASEGNDVTIQSSGEMQDDSFSFAPGPIYIGETGLPTQTNPGSGKLLQSMGVATATDKFRLTLHIPLIRS